MKIGILAGESSGDQLGAQLIKALRTHCPTLTAEGIGGHGMQLEGFNSLYDMERLSVMGLVEPLFRLPELIKMRKQLFQHFIKSKPDLFIGIDSPDFNLGLELKLRRAGMRVAHYVSPSVWAWRQYRIKKIAKAVDLMLTILPFEAEFYRNHHIPVQYVGHPLATKIPLEPDKVAARRLLGIEENVTYVALLPGSRRQELFYMSEPFLLAAKRMFDVIPSLQFLTSHVNDARRQEFFNYFKHLAPTIPLHFYTNKTHDVLAASDAAMVTSGTVTLEAMLFKTPMVIAYKMPKITHQLAKILVKIPHVGLPNILANELIVPELIQEEVQAQNISNILLEYINNVEIRTTLNNKFKQMHKDLIVDKHVLPNAIISLL